MSAPTGGSRPSSSPAARRRRQRIIDATRSQLRERDLEKVAVADVAEQAGVSVATVYNLVGTRERLLVSVVDDYMDGLRRALAAIPPDDMPPDDDPGANALTLIDTAVRLTLEDPLPLRSIVRELGPLQFAEHRRGSMDDLLVERLSGHPDASATARFVAYGFRGLLTSWANGLIDDDRFRQDARELSRRIIGPS